MSSQAWVVRASDSTSTRSSLPWKRPGHRLGGQGPREQAEAVGDRAVLAEVGRVGEADDHARQELRARIVRVDHPAQHVPERRPRGRHRRLLGEELLDLTSSERSPSALSRWRRTSSSLSPGMVRMSTSMSTTSGMTLVFTPPAAHVRRERGVRRRPRELGHARGKLGDGLVDARGIDQRGLHGRVEAERADEGAATDRPRTGAGR